jgi:hypothetical protein
MICRHVPNVAHIVPALPAPACAGCIMSHALGIHMADVNGNTFFEGPLNTPQVCTALVYCPCVLPKCTAQVNCLDVQPECTASGCSPAQAGSSTEQPNTALRRHRSVLCCSAVRDPPHPSWPQNPLWGRPKPRHVDLQQTRTHLGRLESLASEPTAAAVRAAMGCKQLPVDGGFKVAAGPQNPEV